MDIIEKKTTEISEPQWSDYAQSFNKTFEKDFPISYFKQKYQNSCKGFSEHAFLIKEDRIVGAVTGIPYEYEFFGKKVLFGLVIDVFIQKDSRSHPLLLKKIYTRVEKRLKEEGVSFVYAVPNPNSYQYLVKVCKWKDVGSLNFYALPIKIGNIKQTLLKRWVNSVSYFFSKFWISFSGLLINFNNVKVDPQPIKILKTKTVFKQRLGDQYKKINLENSQQDFTYRVFKEDEIVTTYIIDISNFSDKLLWQANNHIFQKEDTDIILYIGSPNVKTMSIFSVPKAFLPERELVLAGKIINPEHVDKRIYDLPNWEFNLFNFDGR